MHYSVQHPAEQVLSGLDSGRVVGAIPIVSVDGIEVLDVVNLRMWYVNYNSATASIPPSLGRSVHCIPTVPAIGYFIRM